MSKADLLLEIGTEEIPAGYVEPALAELGAKLTGWLVEHAFAVAPQAVESFATPRRLAVRIRGVDTQRPRRKEQQLGPPVRAAFDAEGRPTRAAEGFARKHGVSPDQLLRVGTDKGERVAVEVETGGEPLRALLLGDLQMRTLLQLGFPKTMRWIVGSDLRFARPIRWLVCLLGEEVVPLRLEHLTAGRDSRGHRTLAPGPVSIESPAAYEATLAAVGVEVRPQRRRARIEAGGRAAAEAVGGRLHEDSGLLDELVHLCEHPTAVTGSFEPALIDALPPEVIVTAMRAHQRYFSVEDASGRLLPHFVTFRDGGERGLQNVVEGNERVLRARLADAAFYWDTDRALSSEAKLERLEKVVWLEGMGSVRAKCARIAALAVGLSEALQVDVDRDLLRRAALLCKSDLATEMIRDGKEFTKLQGVIGRYYALEAGEDPRVADAIAEHLHPRSAQDRLPEGALGRLVGLADRLDSIAGCVRAGLAPTGGQDPYALRRQALAVLRILLEGGWHLDLETWIERALEAHEGGELPPGPARVRVADLFWGRLETLLSDLPVEIVRGVLSVSRLDPVDNVRAAQALARMRGSESFERLLEGAKRCRNILVKEGRLPEEALEGAERAEALRAEAARCWEAWRAHAAGDEARGFDPARFEDPAEGALHAAVLACVPVLADAAGSGDHEAVFAALAGLGPAIGRYFDEVLVNAENPALRTNRLRFLERIHYLFARFADLSRVVPA